VKAWLARGSCQGSVISSTGAPGWCWRSQAAVRVAFSQVVRAQESPAMLARRLERLEMRLKLLEEEGRGGIDLSRFDPKNFPGIRDES